MVTRTAERHPVGALGRIGIVAALHAGALLVIANGLNLGSVFVEPKTTAVVINEEVPIDDPPPAPQPDFTQSERTVYVPAPDTHLDFEQPDAITGPPPDMDTAPPPAAPPSPKPSSSAFARTRATRSHSRRTPSADIRAGNTGTADIEVYVLPTGRVGDARIVKSTGFESLDRSALDEAKRKWRLAPATKDGVPFAQWHRLRVTFKLNQQR